MEGEGHGIQERERFSQRTSRFVKRNASRVRFFSWKPHYPSGSLKAAAAAKVSYFIITSNEVNVYGHLDYYDAYLEVYAPSVTVGRRKAAAKVPKEVEKSSIDRETSLGEELACGSPGSTAPASQQPMLPAPPSQISSNATTAANFMYLDDGTPR
ncbi:uncharacterized protein LOC142566365 isoform X2 [Dermacentor variabilis]|uniref:uncharacterized protein LOC142566365 isoform X2 n=1 Tax=Dermacentor variabilis TaxID=34621 RepID=UPI003F5B2FEF